MQHGMESTLSLLAGFNFFGHVDKTPDLSEGPLFESEHGTGKVYGRYTRASHYAGTFFIIMGVISTCLWHLYYDLTATDRALGRPYRQLGSLTALYLS